MVRELGDARHDLADGGESGVLSSESSPSLVAASCVPAPASASTSMSPAAALVALGSAAGSAGAPPVALGPAEPL